MKHIWVVIKKDLDKIFKNPRMIFSTLILPGLLLFLIYALMGTSFSNFIDTTKDELKEHKSIIYMYDTPQSFKSFFNDELKSSLNIDQFTINIDDYDNFNIKEYEDKVLNNEIDAIVIFEKNFDDNVGKNNPEINIIYNPTSKFSATAYSKIEQLITMYKNNTLNELLIDQGISADLFKATNKEVFNEKESSGSILSSILPMLIMTFIFSGCLSIGTDAIAGEKERGTLSTLLMAPVKRNNIIGGKIVSTAVLAVLSATSSFIGIIASMPFAKQIFLPENVTISYSVIDYLGIFAIFIVVSFIASSLILIASTVGKTIKEATSYAMPLYIIALLVSVISMFDSDIPKEIIPYFIPLYNTALGLKGILLFQLNLSQFLIIIGSSIIFIIIITNILIKLFKSEKTLFSK